MHYKLKPNDNRLRSVPAVHRLVLGQKLTQVIVLVTNQLKPYISSGSFSMQCHSGVFLSSFCAFSIYDVCNCYKGFFTKIYFNNLLFKQPTLNILNEELFDFFCGN